ncbi:MAG: PD-(D/E)XK nuclease family protein, partial [Acutalibacteraceae bacterium]|nr:PD-(D/E)XK nuclease family protein [Acutalibacteraceae bacterium]
AIRSEVYSYLKELQTTAKNADGMAISRQISVLLTQFAVKEKIKEKISRLTAKNSPELVDEYTRVWNSVVSVISKIANVLEGRIISAKRYYELFSLAIGCEKIANQPLCIDRLIIGTAGRARLNSPKITFLIGAVQGIFPAVPGETGVFTDNERCLLLSLGLQLSCSLSDLSAQEQFSAYSAASSPSERLYVSYYNNTTNGGGALPSTIATQIKRILPQLETKHNCDVYDFDSSVLWCTQQAFEHTVANIKEDDENKVLLEKYFSEQPKYGRLLESIHSYKEKRMPSIDKDTASVLYSKNMHLSASKIDDFYNCAYMYFCKSGLKLKERRKASVDSRQYGSLVHYIMEKFLKLENLEQLIEDRENADVSGYIDTFTKEYIKEAFDDNKLPDNKAVYAVNRAKKSCAVLIKRLLDELAVSEFKPSDFELSIGIKNSNSTQNVIDEYKVETKDGSVSIVGFVDRVDLYKSPYDGKTYVRIVDYKTGNKDLKRCDLEMGLNLQMFIYLAAIMNGGKALYGDNLAPAGVCYMPAKEFNTTITEQGNSEFIKKQMDEKRIKHYQAKGLFLRDGEVLLAMDNQADAKYIPVKVKYDPKKEVYSYPRSEEKLLTGNQHEGEFNDMFKLVNEKIIQMSDMLLDGYISAIPTGTKSETDSLPCQYCNFKNSCVFTDGMKINQIQTTKSEKGDKKGVKKNG